MNLTEGMEVLIVFPDAGYEKRRALVSKIQRHGAVLKGALMADKNTPLYGDYCKEYVFTRRPGGGWAQKGLNEPYLIEIPTAEEV